MRTATPVGQIATLSRQHIYILPTRFGWLFGVLLFTLLMGSINYAISLGFVFTFLLAGFGSISMLYTWRNLAHLQIQMRESPPVFAKETCQFLCTLHAPNQRARFAVRIAFANPTPSAKWRPEANTSVVDLPVDATTLVRLTYPTQQRGYLTMPRLQLSTTFPVSLFHVWAYARLNGRCLVYPTPADPSVILPSLTPTNAQGKRHSSPGDDDFVGHRHYQWGDSPKRVDWKASSRGQHLLTKQFQGEAATTLWLEWQQTICERHEARISLLTRWVITAEKAQQPYGLRLPHLTLQPQHGAQHYHACLTALALMS